MEIIEFKTSFNKKWPLDWLKTQVDIRREKTSTMKYKPCQRRRHSCNHSNNSLLIISDALLSSLLDPLEGPGVLNCEKLELGSHFRLPALKRGRGAC
jgi:hypothetical protein